MAWALHVHWPLSSRKWPPARFAHVALMWEICDEATAVSPLTHSHEFGIAQLFATIKR
jgi:hypothetical protein